MNIAKSVAPEANGSNKGPFLILVVYQKKNITDNIFAGKGRNPNKPQSNDKNIPRVYFPLANKIIREIGKKKKHFTQNDCRS